MSLRRPLSSRSVSCTLRLAVLLLVSPTLAFAEDTAVVSIASTPQRASVFFDNHYAGVTPLTLKGVGYGNHLLVVTKYQYASHSQALRVEQPSVSLNIELKSLGRGRLRVVAVPEETSVFLNGGLKGKSPLTLEDLLPGKYQLGLEADGFFTFQDTVEVRANQETKVEKTLESKSEAYLLAAIEKDPTRVANYYDLAHHYVRSRQFDKAFGMFARGFDACVSPNLVTNEQRRLYDELDRVWEGQYNFADDATREKLHPRILEELEKAIQRQPRNVLTYWSLGSFYQKTNDWAKAADAYERGLNAVKSSRAKLFLEHNLALARYHQGYALEQAQKYDEALTVYEALLRDHPKVYYSRSALTQVAYIWMYYKKDYPKATEAKRRFIQLYPDSDQCPALQMEIASIYLNYSKDYQKAIEAYRTYIATYPTEDSCPTAQLQVVSVYDHYLKDLPAAIKEYERFLSDYPKSDSCSAALSGLFRLYTALAATPAAKAAGAKEKAEEIRKRLLTEYPWSAEAAALDNEPTSQKLRQEAAAAYAQATALAATDAAKAIAAYEEVVRKYPRFSEARSAQVQIITLCANNLKDFEKGNQARQRYIDLFPESDQCPSMLYYIGYTKCYTMKQYEEGVADLRKMIKDYPESDLCVTAQYYIASLYSFSYGHYDREKNIEESRRLIKDYPSYDSNDVVQTSIGLNFFYMFQPGDKEKGQKELLKVIEDYPYGSYATTAEYYLDLIDAGLQLDENRIRDTEARK